MIVKETNAERLRRLRADAVSNGKCQQCRLRPAKPGCVTCIECLDDNAARKEKNIKKRRCPCGKKRVRGKLYCVTCAANRSQRSKERREALLIARLCIQCQLRPAMTRRKRCHECLALECARTRKVRLEEAGGTLARRTCSVCGAIDHNAAQHTRGDQPGELIGQGVALLRERPREIVTDLAGAAYDKIKDAGSSSTIES